MKRLLLLSNSTNYGREYLDHAMSEILGFLGPIKRLLFVPFAGNDRTLYTEKVKARFAKVGVEVDELIAHSGGGRAIEGAEAVFVGGGNTFRLIDRLQRGRYLEPLRRRALEGLIYMGASAGSVIAAPTIKTTNDMPIIQPQWFEGLSLVPFQINAHYMDADPASRHMGETREQRIKEFHEENNEAVVGLREGGWLLVEGDSVRLEGGAPARLFRKGKEPVEVSPGSAIDPLLAG
jgi:dipeptidase E